MFVRAKYLFSGIQNEFEKKNMYSLYPVLKAYWEHVAAFGYFYLKIKELIENSKEDEAFALAKKMGLGGRGFPTPKMIKEKGYEVDDYKLPHIYTMIDTVDKNFKEHFGENNSMMRELYDEQIAEGGHTTYIGLSIAAKWSKDGLYQLPDLKKSWESKDKASLINIFAMASLIFFYYWDKFEELEKKFRK
jgi:hypothetical protein